MIRTLVTVPPLLALAAPVFLPAWGIGVALSIADGSLMRDYPRHKRPGTPAGVAAASSTGAAAPTSEVGQHV